MKARWYIHLEDWLERLAALEGCEVWSVRGAGCARGSDWVRWWLTIPGHMTPPVIKKTKPPGITKTVIQETLAAAQCMSFNYPLRLLCKENATTRLCASGENYWWNGRCFTVETTTPFFNQPTCNGMPSFWRSGSSSLNEKLAYTRQTINCNHIHKAS